VLQIVKIHHYFESNLKCHEHNAHSKPTVNSSHSAVRYCPAIPGTVTLLLYVRFMSVCITETRTVMCRLLWNVVLYCYVMQPIYIIKSTD
jgi:hypothetical protein